VLSRFAWGRVGSGQDRPRKPAGLPARRGECLERRAGLAGRRGAEAREQLVEEAQERDERPRRTTAEDGQCPADAPGDGAGMSVGVSRDVGE
jgi:hypothetical protein